MTRTASLAQWLATHVDVIAQDELAGDIYRDIRNAVDAIERVINRPHDPKYCGPCPHINEDQQPCGVGLFAEWNEENKNYNPEVACWKCHTTFNAEKLITDALGDVDGWLFTAQEILETMKHIGEPISDRTWRHWRKTGAIQSRNEVGAEPKYYIGEVRYLRQNLSKLRAS